jgi:hypothetical protein
MRDLTIEASNDNDHPNIIPDIVHGGVDRDHERINELFCSVCSLF